MSERVPMCEHVPQSEMEWSHAGPSYQHQQFDDVEQQRWAQSLGMWLFLATEAMMFGGLFLAYATYRWLYPETFVSGSHLLNLTAGTINTFVLLLSSLTVALAGSAAQERRRSALQRLLWASALLGLLFLAIKGYEWREDYRQGLVPFFHWTHFAEHPAEAADFARHGVRLDHVQLFYFLYFFMVGLHALHLLVGVGVVSTLAWMERRGAWTNGNHHPVEVAGLYWHFVDVIWVFLYPLFYLPGGFRPH